jgi:hypothetical protein
MKQTNKDTITIIIRRRTTTTTMIIIIIIIINILIIKITMMMMMMMNQYSQGGFELMGLRTNLIQVSDLNHFVTKIIITLNIILHYHLFFIKSKNHYQIIVGLY